MTLVNEENKEKFFTSFQSLVSYLLENSGIQEEDLPPLLETFLSSKLATEQDVTDNTNVQGLITVTTAATAARKAIEEWVQLAPESLDTLHEIATALQNDPEIIQKLFDLLAGKASKKDLDKRQLTSNVDFNKESWDEFFTWGAAGFAAMNAGIYHGVATAGRIGLSAEYADIAPEEECNLNISVSVEQYRVVTLTQGNFISDQVRIPVNHLNQVEQLSFLKNGVRSPVLLEDIDSSSETELLISNTDWLVDDEIKLVFITHVPMSMPKKVYVAATTYAQGADFYRSAKTINGTLQTQTYLTSNVWRSNSMDLSFTIETIISAINDAIPDDEANPQ